MDLDLDHLRSWIGREEAKSEPVTTALVERFDATFGRTGDTTPGAVAPVIPAEATRMSIPPPSASASCLQMASPRPVPGPPRSPRAAV